MKLVIDRYYIVPDGDACDRCPRTLGRGGRKVQVDGRWMRVCFKCVAELRRKASAVSAVQL